MREIVLSHVSFDILENILYVLQIVILREYIVFFECCKLKKDIRPQSRLFYDVTQLPLGDQRRSDKHTSPWCPRETCCLNDITIWKHYSAERPLLRANVARRRIIEWDWWRECCRGQLWASYHSLADRLCECSSPGGSLWFMLRMARYGVLSFTVYVWKVPIWSFMPTFMVEIEEVWARQTAVEDERSLEWLPNGNKLQKISVCTCGS